MLLLKSTVRFKSNPLAMATAVIIVNEVFKSHGYDCIITSANDSAHSEGSLHTVDGAIDLRSKHLTETMKDEILAELKVKLDYQFDIILEGRGTLNEHFHLEHDPK